MASVKRTFIGNIKGQPGVDGKTAYEYAKDGGYTGTEEEFIALLGSAQEFASNAEQSAIDAEESEGAAAQSAANALNSESAASQSATNAGNSESAAAQSAINAESSEAAAAQSAANAGNSETAAAQSAEDAETAASAAAKSETAAKNAQQAIENMTVEGTTVSSDSPASVKKTTSNGVVNLTFSIPHGESGVYIGPAPAPDWARVWINPDENPTNTEEWEFEMDDSTTETKTVVVIK